MHVGMTLQQAVSEAGLLRNGPFPASPWRLAACLGRAQKPFIEPVRAQRTLKDHVASLTDVATKLPTLVHDHPRTPAYPMAWNRPRRSRAQPGRRGSSPSVRGIHGSYARLELHMIPQHVTSHADKQAIEQRTTDPLTGQHRKTTEYHLGEPSRNSGT